MRLFVAVNLPEGEKTTVATILDELRAMPVPIRWVAPESLHLTMKFLGEVADERCADIVAAMQRAAAGHKAFELAVGGFGVFPTRTRARVFWIGVEATAALEILQDSVEQEMAALGFTREKRAFQPHLTLGRTKANQRVAGADVDRIAARVVYNATIEVESLDLMRSHLSPKGARYEKLERAPLD